MLNFFSVGGMYDIQMHPYHTNHSGYFGKHGYGKRIELPAVLPALNDFSEGNHGVPWSK